MLKDTFKISERSHIASPLSAPAGQRHLLKKEVLAYCTHQAIYVGMVLRSSRIVASLDTLEWIGMVVRIPYGYGPSNGFLWC